MGSVDEIIDDAQSSLDPTDWPAFRAQSHRMLEDMLDYVEHIRSRPVWQPIPEEARAAFQKPLPHSSGNLVEAHQVFLENVLPYSVGNVHPGFMGWVHGGGTVVGMMAEMLAAGLNANLGGRDQMPIEVERQIVRWMRELFRFPETASGLFVTGTSMANWMGLLVARTAALGSIVRKTGLSNPKSPHLIAYASEAIHGCVARSLDFMGLGTAALRIIPMNARQEIKIEALQLAIVTDKAAGLQPFCIIGTAGTVNTGAIDDLATLAKIAKQEGLWFHVDGAYGALGMLSPEIAPRLVGIEQADSLAFDFHKWGQVPYDSGFLLVRDATKQLDTFSTVADYLRRETRGLAGGSPWPCDFGPDLSRGFRALKTWFTFSVYGSEQLGTIISQTCHLAQYLATKIQSSPVLELLAPVSLNIVCFRYRSKNSDSVNAAIVVDLHESGIVAPSTTLLNGWLAIRAAIVNHRTGSHDLDELIRSVLLFGQSHDSDE